MLIEPDRAAFGQERRRHVERDPRDLALRALRPRPNQPCGRVEGHDRFELLHRDHAGFQHGRRRAHRVRPRHRMRLIRLQDKQTDIRRRIAWRPGRPGPAGAAPGTGSSKFTRPETQAIRAIPETAAAGTSAARSEPRRPPRTGSEAARPGGIRVRRSAVRASGPAQPPSRARSSSRNGAPPPGSPNRHSSSTASGAARKGAVGASSAAETAAR